MAILFNEIQFIKSFEYKFWTYNHNGHKKTFNQDQKLKSKAVIKLPVSCMVCSCYRLSSMGKVTEINNLY